MEDNSLHLQIAYLSCALELKKKSYPDISDINDMIEYNSKQPLIFIGIE
ncbi:hypothetical protein [Clostridium beijerinckii]|nr:hypothetical protein [Clostridium beijerinckii]